jgi:hypothetical protein
MNFCRLTIQEPIFSVSDTEFEGGDDGHGHGDCTFLVKQAQPSHKPRELGASFPALHQAQIKIPDLGQTVLPRVAHLLAQTGYFFSAWFSLGNDSSPQPR